MLAPQPAVNCLPQFLSLELLSPHLCSCGHTFGFSCSMVQAPTPFESAAEWWLYITRLFSYSAFAFFWNGEPKSRTPNIEWTRSDQKRRRDQKEQETHQSCRADDTNIYWFPGDRGGNMEHCLLDFAHRIWLNLSFQRLLGIIFPHNNIFSSNIATQPWKFRKYINTSKLSAAFSLISAP